MPKKTRGRRSFEKEHGKGSRSLLKSAQQHLYQIYWSRWKKLSRKKSLLVICNILELFVNTLTTHNKYFLRDRENLTQPIEMQLSYEDRFFS